MAPYRSTPHDFLKTWRSKKGIWWKELLCLFFNHRRKTIHSEDKFFGSPRVDDSNIPGGAMVTQILNLSIIVSISTNVYRCSWCEKEWLITKSDARCALDVPVYFDGKKTYRPGLIFEEDPAPYLYYTGAEAEA